jgi:hypothetical protein
MYFDKPNRGVGTLFDEGICKKVYFLDNLKGGYYLYDLGEDDMSALRKEREELEISSGMYIYHDDRHSGVGSTCETGVVKFLTFYTPPKEKIFKKVDSLEIMNPSPVGYSIGDYDYREFLENNDYVQIV